MRVRIGMRGFLSTACIVCLLFAIGLSTGAITGSVCQAGPVENDLGDLEGSVDLGWEMADWTMKYVNPASPPSGWNSATLLPYAVPEYHWWNGCSPTAAGMLFAYWETHLGKQNLYTFHDGNSAYWDRTNMNMSREADYGRNGVAPSRATHSIVASWEHRQAGIAKGLTYGSWDRNGNGFVDASDRAQWNCLADFMRTENGGTSRSRMAQGFIDFAAWDDPTTPVSEAYYATSSTKTSTRSWTGYMSEINNGYPVHVGIEGHSILGVGFWTDPNGVYGAPGTQYVVNKTTWGGGSADKYGLIEFSEVYAYTILRIGDSVVPINQAPIANNGFYSLNEDVPLVTYTYDGVLANDTDPEGVALQATLLSNPSHGSLDFSTLGWFTYTPNRDYYGTDIFTYRAFDGVNYSNPTTVYLNIAAVNDPPIAVDDFYSTDIGAALIRYAHNGVL
ncbi:MAG: cadherin-like domain-containing protein, partial [Pirellulaceae bacterium]|nr:cadherin-like domain-containing protein [Pirellulaceae bacterium]